MDPNTTLANLRDAIKACDTAKDDTELIYAGIDLRNAAEALDAWLSNKGFLPKAWDRIR